MRNGRALLMCLLLALPAPGPVQACPVQNEELQVTLNGHVLSVELATGLAGHMCGLAFRQSLPPDRGMLFAYAYDQVIAFWMKNTLIDLSIAFLDANGKILEIHDMDADDPGRRYLSASPARYALEVNQGWFRKHGVRAGDRVIFDLHEHPAVFRYPGKPRPGPGVH